MSKSKRELKDENIVIADVTDSSSLASAMEGMEKVVLCTSAVPKVRVAACSEGGVFTSSGRQGSCHRPPERYTKHDRYTKHTCIPVLTRIRMYTYVHTKMHIYTHRHWERARLIIQGFELIRGKRERLEMRLGKKKKNIHRASSAVHVFVDVAFERLETYTSILSYADVSF